MGDSCCGCEMRDDCCKPEEMSEKTESCICPECNCDPCECGEETEGSGKKKDEKK